MKGIAFTIVATLAAAPVLAEDLLPALLRDGNPFGLPRRIDGELE